MKHYVMRQYKDYADGLLQIQNNRIGSVSSNSARYIENPFFSLDDIVIDDKSVDDPRCGWHDTRYVCVKRFCEEDYMEKYGSPQCIGMCATDYEKD